MNTKSQQSIKTGKKLGKNMKKILFFLIIGMYLLSGLNMAYALKITSVSTTPSMVSPGEKFEIEVKIENEIEEDITDVAVSLNLQNLPFAPYDSSSEKNFETIESDKSKIASFDLISLNDAAAGIYKIPLEIKYTDENEQTKSRSSLVSVSISSKPIIDIDLGESDLIKGRDGTINLKIINKGLGNAQFLEAKINPTYFSLISSDKAYIGNINTDDFDSAEFKIRVKDNAPSTINIPITINYKDSFNNEYSEEFNGVMRVYSLKEAQDLGIVKKNNTLTYVGIAVGLVIIWLVYRGIRKSMLSRKNAS